MPENNFPKRAKSSRAITCRPKGGLDHYLETNLLELLADLCDHIAYSIEYSDPGNEDTRHMHAVMLFSDQPWAGEGLGKKMDQVFVQKKKNRKWTDYYVSAHPKDPTKESVYPCFEKFKAVYKGQDHWNYNFWMKSEDKKFGWFHNMPSRGDGEDEWWGYMVKDGPATYISDGFPRGEDLMEYYYDDGENAKPTAAKDPYLNNLSTLFKEHDLKYDNVEQVKWGLKHLTCVLKVARTIKERELTCIAKRLCMYIQEEVVIFDESKKDSDLEGALDYIQERIWDSGLNLKENWWDMNEEKADQFHKIVRDIFVISKKRKRD